MTVLAAAVVAALVSTLSAAPVVAQTGTFTLSSPAFGSNASIPLRHSAYGENVSPALNWTGAPAGIHSFALVLSDPDAGGFVHWVIYNIPATATGLPEGIPTDATLATPAGARQGLTGLRRTGYFGPRPPAGAPHRYNFTLYALHSPPTLAEGLTSQTLLAEIQPHAVAQTTLVGVYQAQ